MPRPRRLDFKSAIHTVRVQGREGANIFFDARELLRFPKNAWGRLPHMQRFEQLLISACAECGVVLYAYDVEPNAVQLVLQRAGAPLEAFMQRLCGQYSRYWRNAEAVAGAAGPFGGRYDSKVLAPEYVPHAVRRAHSSPLLAGLCQRVFDYPFSSARAYLGWPGRVALDRGVLTAALERRGLFGIQGYREFMGLPETPFVANLFEHGSAFDSRIVGNRSFVMQARQAATQPLPLPSQEQLIAGVAQLIGQVPAELFAATHQGVLGRALVAWYGLRAGAATLREMGQWFSVSGATLGQGIRHYRRVVPELFEKAELAGLKFQPGTELARKRRDRL
jgi:hypothetical protein